jgi:acyl-CoA synthetase (AMP-forming)/AMP-acid ligase II
VEAAVPVAEARSHPLLDDLRVSGRRGLVVFTSGTTGRPKAVLQSVDRLLRKFDTADRPLRTLACCSSTTSPASTRCCTRSPPVAAGWSLARRDPESSALRSRHAREVLNTSPSFLRLLWASGRAADEDLGSVEIVTYGASRWTRRHSSGPGGCSRAPAAAEVRHDRDRGAAHALGGGRQPAHPPVHRRCRRAGARRGAVDPQSRRALGYLNAPSPIDAEGWYCTGDLVDEGDDVAAVPRARQRAINVGGEKVSPAAVEQVILELPEVVHVVVHGRAHPLLGQVVAATVSLRDGADPSQIERVVRRHCRDHLPRHAVPVTVDVAEAGLVSGRQKLQRRETPRD